jgi:hypothetical protein
VDEESKEGAASGGEESNNLDLTEVPNAESMFQLKSIGGNNLMIGDSTTLRDEMVEDLETDELVKQFQLKLALLNEP